MAGFVIVGAVGHLLARLNTLKNGSNERIATRVNIHNFCARPMSVLEECQLMVKPTIYPPGEFGLPKSSSQLLFHDLAIDQLIGNV